ncbi:uncharacterized protein LOC115954183 isoform X2 [Quercus lobata]|uniref:uncharacterized protein LOC115954183 isoform X2 n=1 Tax=Quercus lobata TaxID=97700 RepID=UPI0012478BE9|nr:uncharacterized protein LOC115954183 isoform X2 [Quercus lobata]
MGNAQSPPANPRYASASRAFSKKELEDLKSLFASLAAQSQTNNQYIVPSVFKTYFGLHGPLGDRMFDLVSQQRKDQRLSFQDLVIAKGTYEKGTKDDIEEFIYQLVDVSGDGILARSDLESVLIAMFGTIFSEKDAELGPSSQKDVVDIFLNAATFSKHVEGSAEKSMSFEDFRNWCALLPSVKKYLASLLMPPDAGVEWVIVQLNCRKDDGPTVLIIKDKEGCVYGGYASQPFERHGDFYGDMKSFLFQLYPKASIFRPTGANKNLQWCAVNFSSDDIPNGIGFGGRVNHFGLFLSASFDQGHTFNCTTFGSPCLSKTSRICPEVIECWRVVPKGKQGTHDAVKGSVLERFKEDRHMLNMVGLANSSE